MMSCLSNKLAEYAAARGTMHVREDAIGWSRTCAADAPVRLEKLEVEDMRIYLTVEQAISVLPTKDSIHTFCNPAFGLIGSDYERERLIKKIESSDFIEITGEQAQGIGHGIAIYKKDSRHENVLFVETDMDKLKKLDSELSTDKVAQ